MARREAGTDRLARLSPAESLQNQSICNPLCTGNADIFFCRPRREVWGLQTLARFRISGGGGGHFDRWNGVLLLVRKDCANVKFTTCFDKTHPFTENTLSFPVQIENLTLAKVFAYE